MNKISVLMPVYNGEKYVAEAIESVLRQSFGDFELIVVDDGSTDHTLSIVRRFDDPRIVLIQNHHDFIGSLNLGLAKASGKYIARMDSDDVMHVDRLKIQYSLMEEDPEIAVCGTWLTPFGEEVNKGRVLSSLTGVVREPLLQMLKGNILFHPTVMMRTSFLREHQLRYEEYMSAEDFKLWFEIALRGGTIYIESLPLLYYRVSAGQVSRQKSHEQNETTWRIKQEIISCLLGMCDRHRECIDRTYQDLLSLQALDLLSENHVAILMHDCLQKALKS